MGLIHALKAWEWRPVIMNSEGLVTSLRFLSAGHLVGEEDSNDVAEEAADDHQHHERPEAPELDAEQLASGVTD